MDVLELPLTPYQAKLFGSVLSAQRQHGKAVIFLVVTDSYVPEVGRSVVRLQAQTVSWKCAQKISKLIRDDTIACQTAPKYES
jgi:hypothetical protein